jgi:TldD protein
MSDIALTDDLFYNRTGMDIKRVESLTDNAIGDCDDGELFLEYRQSESITYDDGRVANASFDNSQGFGLRGVNDEATAYAHSTELTETAITRAGNSVRTIQSRNPINISDRPTGTNIDLYTDKNPLGSPSFEDKVELLSNIDSYARKSDQRVRQVTASLAGSWQAVQICRAGGMRVADIRPMVRLSVSIMVGDGNRQETGSQGAGGRTSYDQWLSPDKWQIQVDEALRQALVNLEAVPAPAGEMPIVLGPGWPGVLLHEAIGHGLEGDFNRKKTSAFSELLGQRVAAPGVTVVDDGTIPDRRGSITIDDEGTPSNYNILIEDGILKGYMQDRLNARLMGVNPTGNGRRQSYAHSPMPRMTNTYMLNGNSAPEECIQAVSKGIYAVNFGGGQVDITNGKFVFSCTEAYLIENGKITAPVKGATLIGNGPDALTRVKLIANDSKLDDGVGTCGKDGQSVPVGVGQPTMMLDCLTVGGTAV